MKWDCRGAAKSRVQGFGFGFEEFFDHHKRLVGWVLRWFEGIARRIFPDGSGGDEFGQSRGKILKLLRLTSCMYR